MQYGDADAPPMDCHREPGHLLARPLRRPHANTHLRQGVRTRAERKPEAVSGDTISMVQGDNRCKQHQTCPCFRIFCIVRRYSCLIF
jgi:hypothetical protein